MSCYLLNVLFYYPLIELLWCIKLFHHIWEFQYIIRIMIFYGTITLKSNWIRSDIKKKMIKWVPIKRVVDQDMNINWSRYTIPNLKHEMCGNYVWIEIWYNMRVHYTITWSTACVGIEIWSYLGGYTDLGDTQTLNLTQKMYELSVHDGNIIRYQRAHIWYFYIINNSN